MQTGYSHSIGLKSSSIRICGNFTIQIKNKDKLIRYFRVLRATELNSLQSYLMDVTSSRKAAYYDILLDPDAEEHSINIAGKPSRHSDMPHIDTMILIFELLWKRPAMPAQS